jgi:MAE_28990/MAE_18760-like HEPN
LSFVATVSWARHMFPALKSEIVERFTAVEEYFRESRKFKGEPLQTAKGLVFVQIYAIHEYAVRSVVRMATDVIAAHGPTYAKMRPSLLALFLDREFCSLRDCSAKDVWDRRVELLDRALSSKQVSLTSSPFPQDGTHFRRAHVLLILRVFGVRRTLTVRRRHLYRIDEVVDHRNSIAHGGETAGDVGRRYSREEILQVIREMKGTCLRLIMIFDEHCSQPAKHRR